MPSKKGIVVKNHGFNGDHGRRFSTEKVKWRISLSIKPDEEIVDILDDFCHRNGGVGYKFLSSQTDAITIYMNGAVNKNALEELFVALQSKLLPIDDYAVAGFRYIPNNLSTSKFGISYAPEFNSDIVDGPNDIITRRLKTLGIFEGDRKMFGSTGGVSKSYGPVNTSVGDAEGTIRVLNELENRVAKKLLIEIPHPYTTALKPPKDLISAAISAHDLRVRQIPIGGGGHYSSSSSSSPRSTTSAAESVDGKWGWIAGGVLLLGAAVAAVTMMNKPKEQKKPFTTRAPIPRDPNQPWETHLAAQRSAGDSGIGIRGS